MYPKNAHYIWVGNKPLPQYAISNIIHFKSNNPHYTVYLWTTNTHRIVNNIINSGYSSRFMSIINCCDLPDMTGYIQSAVEREMSDSAYHNYAAASDILRLVILEKFGGIYMDVDVMVSGSLGIISPERANSTGMSDILIHQEILSNKKRLSNAVIVSQPHTNTLKKMINYAVFPYAKNSLYEMGFGRTAGKDLLRKTLKDLKDIPLREIMWVGKRAVPSLRHQITIYLTGPGLMDAYLQASGLSQRFQTTKILNEPARFGQREDNFPGSWKRGMNGKGEWVLPARKFNSTI
ncbi:glycosyltransferase family 32 protein [Yersinia enterocolitica]|uniref:glycosyltransferase family 32 protein n=1 Tax=Yersinia enterocolitica TaxID=630 RepID=UPI00398CC831